MGFVKAIIRVLTLSCTDAARLMSESLDHRLRPAERIALRAHLFICAACRQYRRQLQFIEDAVRELRAKAERSDDAPISSTALPAEARDRIKRSLRNR